MPISKLTNSQQRNSFWILLWLLPFFSGYAQQVQWATVLPLPKTDWVQCIAKDTNGFLYCGGETQRNREYAPGGYYINRTLFIKLDSYGDTIYVRNLGIPGRIYGMVIDPYGMIRAVVKEQFAQSTLYVSISPEGFVFQKDSIQRTEPRACILGKDSSFIFVGYMDRPGFPAERSMYFQRIQKDGLVDPIVELNPGHPNCVANRVEQLPNGHYLVSGYVGSRIASYELDEWGMNPVFKQWYQTPDFSNLSTGYVSRINGQRYMIGGQGNPSRVGIVDSLGQRIWLRSDDGVQIPPQAMTDGSLVFGYETGPPIFQSLFRIGPDSSTIWDMKLKDSLVARGMNGQIQVKSFSYFEDQTAVLAGRYYLNGTTDYDPIFLRIANVGTPVTSLSKPKKGPLQNETLAPWPNPSDGTLYLKQHFDKAKIHLYQLSGQEVAQYQIRFGQPIQINHLPAGLYLYRAVIDGKAFSGKIVRN